MVSRELSAPWRETFSAAIKKTGGNQSMNSPYIHERRRIMDPAKKVKFCQLIRESQTIEHAAEWVDVSIRTVQRERKRDEDFDHEVRLALQATPDPLTLMENAARTHWRAAAWLLERTRPEQFARKPANTARDYQVEAALHMLLEAALAATAPAEWFTAPGWFNEQPAAPLSPKTAEATPSDATPAPRSHAPRGNATPDAPRRAPRLAADQARHDAAPATPQFAGQGAGSTLDAERREERGIENADDNLSPETHDATADDATAVAEEPTAAVDYNLPIDLNLRFDDFAAAVGVLDQHEQDLLWDQRLRHWSALKRRREAQPSRTKRQAA